MSTETSKNPFSDKNSVHFTGRLAHTPEVRYTQGGTMVVSANVAIKEQWDKNGEMQEKTHWVSVVMFGDGGEPFSQQADKGDWIEVKGKLSYRAWETDNQEKRSKLEVQAFEMSVKKKKEQHAESTAHVS
ncbi:MAG: single-stranded DNA-binding protein [Nitrospirales bacterium]|nr:MAG: single-stranded DNA-binding protein [Nitrospirales bacterium]